ncbi:MAG: peptidoglycan-binding protein [Clostridia bacterium]|nr:peptidoglycan-binding protein [Clostridia bacterium]
MEILRYGSTGPYVEMLQLALLRSGYLNSQPDGIFGTHTQNSVMRFQRANGLSPDGIVGPLTYAAIKPYITGYTVHQIRRGDSFYKLAKAYGTPIEYIISANPDVDPLRLMIDQKIIIPYGFDVVPTTISYTYLLTQLCIEGLSVRYPSLQRGSIGQSVLGNELYSIRIGNGSKNVMYNASHHANEWITTPVLLHFAEEYLKALLFMTSIGSTPATELFNTTVINIIPLVNPDGVDLVTGALDKNSTAYKNAQIIAGNYPQISFPSGWKANIEGTDLNLNYPAGWENAREIKFAQGFDSPAPRDYVGTAPLSAPESRAMVSYTQENNFRLTLSYHTQGEVIFWKYLDYMPPKAFDIGLQLSRASGYSLEITPTESGYAGYKDWFIQTFNLPGYTIEAGLGGNPLPISDFPQIYRDNEKLLVLAAMLS